MNSNQFRHVPQLYNSVRYEPKPKTVKVGSVYITPIETIDPPADATVRTFFCTICDNAHLQSGPIVRVWRDTIQGVEGYATNASPDCLAELL